MNPLRWGCPPPVKRRRRHRATASVAECLGALVAKPAAWSLRRRGLARAQIPLFEVGLGFMFGSRLLMVEHTGRHSGLARRVILEVIGHPAPDVYMVSSGFGRTSQWFRNIQANPGIRIWVGRRRALQATASILAPDDSQRAIGLYAEQHALAWAVLRPTLETTLGGPIDQMPVVAVTVTGPA